MTTAADSMDAPRAQQRAGQARPGRRLGRAAPWLVAALAVAVYLNALRNGFALDDVWIVPGNLDVIHLSNLLELWTRPYWPGPTGPALGLYRPLPISFYNLQWAIGGGAPWLFHAVNIALHAAVSVLVYRLLRSWLARAASAAGALVFAVHPVHTEAVANVVGQAELLGALFTLLACLLVLSPRLAARPAVRIAAVALCYAAAMASKESALVMPALLALVMAVEPARARGWRAAVGAWLEQWRLFAVLAAIAVAMLALRWIVLGSALSVEAPWVPFADDPYARVLTALRLWIEYARLLFFPVDLSSDYSVAVIVPAESISLDVVLGALLLLATLALTLLLPRLPMVGLGAGWFLTSILPTSNLLVVAGVVIAERALYLPSVGVALAIAAAVQVATTRERRIRMAAFALLAVVLIGYGVRTWIRNPDWASTEAVNVALLRDHPESYKSQWFAAAIAFGRGDTLEAADRFRLATRMQPDSPPLLGDYGEFLLQTGAPDSAVRVLERATSLRHYSSKIDNLLALAHLRAGDCAASLDRLRLARERSSPEWQRRLLTVENLVALGRLQDAADSVPGMATAPGPARTFRWALAAQVATRAGRHAEAAAAADSGRAVGGDYARMSATARGRLEQLALTPCRLQ